MVSRPAGRPEEHSTPGRMRTARGCSKRGSPLLGVSNRVGLGRGRNRNLPLPSVVSLWFFLFGQAKRKNTVSLRIRRSAPRGPRPYRAGLPNQYPPGPAGHPPLGKGGSRPARATARAERSGGRPYGMTEMCCRVDSVRPSPVFAEAYREIQDRTARAGASPAPTG